MSKIAEVWKITPLKITTFTVIVKETYFIICIFLGRLKCYNSVCFDLNQIFFLNLPACTYHLPKKVVEDNETIIFINFLPWSIV